MCNVRFKIKGQVWEWQPAGQAQAKNTWRRQWGRRRREATHSTQQNSSFSWLVLSFDSVTLVNAGLLEKATFPSFLSLSLPLLHQMSYSLTRFAIYETVRDMMGSSNKGPMPFYQKVLLGAFGGQSAHTHLCNISCEKGRADADQFCLLTVCKDGRCHVTHWFP